MLLRLLNEMTTWSIVLEKLIVHLAQGFSAFSRPGATFTISCWLAACSVVNEDSLLKHCYSVLNSLQAFVGQSLECLTTDWTTGVRSWTGENDFYSTSASRLPLGPTQPPIQWVPGVLSLRVKCSHYVTLTPQPHLLSRSRMSRRCISCPLLDLLECHDSIKMLLN
jgi:hypothetical protein